MVRITIHVRPRNGYTKPKLVKSIPVDTSARLEQVVHELKLDTKKGIALYAKRRSHGDYRELALNTSLASNNVQDGDMIETCACPQMATILALALRDMEAASKLLPDERTQARLEPLFGRIEPWQASHWDDDRIKSRIICMALMKKLLQRQDRFANLVVPHCATLMQLYQFLQTTDTFADNYQYGRRRSHNSMAHLFKPSTGRDGRPSTVWQLLQNKLNKLEEHMMCATAQTEQGRGSTSLSCPIDTFLAAERQRHDNIMGISSTPSSRASRRASPASDTPTVARKRRRINVPNTPSTRWSDQQWMCHTCQTAPATCMCLDDTCPFAKQTSCVACFSANHPIRQRNHARTALSDPAAKDVLKSMHRQDKRDLYCPQYGSGPFAILATLHEQARRGQYSLDESRLKELAQRSCRSNLYDHQAQGRNAFACIEGLMEKNLVRMERLPRSDEEGIYSLLPGGEGLAECCYIFQKRIEAVQGNLQAERETVPSRRANPINIIVDTREDQEYANRLSTRCQAEGVPMRKQELPAGDYLFLFQEKVCPIVIERKSWSDLADSVLGKGRSQRRLDCVGIGRNQSQCENGRCQLCKMKASGCAKIMFIIEGARCTSGDHDPNRCTPVSRCQFCRELQQRHGALISHEALEEVLLKLQVQHGCFVQYTQSYNQTIDVLLTVRDILGGKIAAGTTTMNRFDLGPMNLTFDQFCANSRQKGRPEKRSVARPSVKTWDDTYL